MPSLVPCLITFLSTDTLCTDLFEAREEDSRDDGGLFLLSLSLCKSLRGEGGRERETITQRENAKCPKETAGDCNKQEGPMKRPRFG